VRCDVNAEVKDGHPPIHYARLYHRKEVVELLEREAAKESGQGTGSERQLQGFPEGKHGD